MKPHYVLLRGVLTRDFISLDGLPAHFLRPLPLTVADFSTTQIAPGLYAGYAGANVGRVLVMISRCTNNTLVSSPANLSLTSVHLLDTRPAESRVGGGELPLVMCLERISKRPGRDRRTNRQRIVEHFQQCSRDGREHFIKDFVLRTSLCGEVPRRCDNGKICPWKTSPLTNNDRTKLKPCRGLAIEAPTALGSVAHSCYLLSKALVNVVHENVYRLF